MAEENQVMTNVEENQETTKGPKEAITGPKEVTTAPKKVTPKSQRKLKQVIGWLSGIVKIEKCERVKLANITSLRLF